ncbi:hypothetical protein VMCG_02603 [Cytospora schulzeri]|uniref:Uncharacterized protein n=1 Tax=Cytospora schulzeri TaxID=448051 RepID=A0A423X1U9_9PEZI|nr:hypothetical protein VMCG_02603 [Valsa malicola]
MCRFAYKKFDTCGDYGIEVQDFCDQALWKAGVHGVLQVCVPAILESDDYEPPQVVKFIGYEGFCGMCVDRYKLPPTISRRSYSDHELDHRKESNAFDPHSLAPYILTQCFWARIPDLLGIVDQFEGSQTGQGPYIMFPKLVEQMTWSELRNSVPFMIDGVLEDESHHDLEEVLERLNITGGISDWDKECILKAIQAGINLRAMIFKPRGMSFGDFDAIVECLRAAAIQVLTKTAEDLRQQEAFQQNPEVSDVSTLTSLETTPELSDLDVDLNPEFTTPVKSARKNSARLRNMSENKQKSGSSRKGKLAQAAKLVQPAVETQSTPERPSSSRPRKSSRKSSKKKEMSRYEVEQERMRGILQHLRDHDTLDDYKPAVESSDEAIASPAPARKSSAAKPAKKKSNVLPPVDLGERLRQIAKQERTIEQLRQRKPSSIGFGGGSMAQTLLGGGPSNAVQQTPGGRTVGDRTASNTTNDESAGSGSSPALGDRTMRESAAETSDPGSHPPHGYDLSSPQSRGTNRTFDSANASETQLRHVVQEPPGAHNAAAFQGFQMQQNFNHNIIPRLSPETIQRLAESTGHPFYKGAAVLARERATARSGGWQQQAHDLPQLPQNPTQPSQFGSQQLAYGLPPVPQTQYRPSQFGAQQLANGLPQLPQIPTQHSHSGLQHTPYGLPQLPRTPTQSSQYDLPWLSQDPAHPSHFGAAQQSQMPQPRPRPQQLAHGLPQLPLQSSSQSSQGTQYFQGFGRPPRDGMQNPTSSRASMYLHNYPVDDDDDEDEDEDLQFTSRDEWQNSNRKRRAH